MVLTFLANIIFTILYQAVAMLDAFIVMATPDPTVTHTNLKERECNQDDGKGDQKDENSEEERMDVDKNNSSLHPGTETNYRLLIWNYFKAFLLPFFESCLDKCEGDVFISALLIQGTWSVTKKSFSEYIRCLNDKCELWETVLSKISSVVGHILSSMTPDNIVATITMEMSTIEVRGHIIEGSDRLDYY